VTAVGVSATIATYRCRPGLSVRRIVFTEASGTLRIVAKLFAFFWKQSPVIESAVLSWESLLKIQRVMAVMIGIVLPLLAAGAQAAELKVYSSTAVKAVLEELGPQFEKATGDKLVFTFGLSSAVKKQIDEGAAFDVAVLTPALIDGLAAGKIDPASRVAIARAGSGVSVPAGSPKPDVSTAEALKRTLLQAKSIGFTGVGVSRAGNEALLAKLGIADQVKPKIKLLNESAPVAVAKGEVEIGLGPMSEVLLVPGVQLAGPYPAGLQSYLVFMVCVSSASKNADAARSLIKFLTAPAAAPVFKAKDMEPG
jgi:molybdate transport system substrate-binding protein